MTATLPSEPATSRAPLVSAIVATRNRATLLPRALDSVLAQSHSRLELVVVDDGSVDETPDVVDAYAAKFALTYIRHAHPLGASAARNTALAAARGAFVAGLDDDDEWHRDRIAAMLSEESSEVACVTSDIRLVFPRGAVVWRKKRLITLDDLLYSNQVGNHALVRRERLLAVGGFDVELPAAQDYDLWLRLCREFGPIRNVRAPLQTVYIHRRARISTSNRASVGYYRVYRKNKPLMTEDHRRYQLYTIRRAQGKASRLIDLLTWVPPRRIPKELSRRVVVKILGS